MSLAKRRDMVDRKHLLLSIARRCSPLGVARSSLYYRPAVISLSIGVVRASRVSSQVPVLVG